MVLDELKNAHLYHGIAKRMADAFTFLRRNDLASLPIGKCQIDGDEVFAIVQEYETRLPEAVQWEAHRRYIDVQYLMTGIERIGHGFIDHFGIRQEYDADGDYLLLDGRGDEFVMVAGTLAIFMPHDVHRPTLAAEKPLLVRKIVVKVLID